MIVRRLYFALMIAQAAPAPAPRPVTWSPSLQVPSLSAIDALLGRPLDEVRAAVLDDRPLRPMKNCRDVLAMVDAGINHLSPEDNTVAWQSFQVDLVRCSTLKILKAARPASTSYLEWFTLNGPDVRKLPAGVAPSFSDREIKALAKAQKRCTSWGSYQPHLKVSVEGGDAALDGPGWAGHIFVSARGDLNGDGIEDLLLERMAVAKGGGAIPDASDQLFIVTQDSKTSCPRIAWSLRDLGG